jgi:hypothetical protein
MAAWVLPTTIPDALAQTPADTAPVVLTGPPPVQILAAELLLRLAAELSHHPVAIPGAGQIHAIMQQDFQHHQAQAG